ncbi:MAG: hypothetical protein IT447_00510 [Phycisphaerales bacterium]|jgi:hypothetical protein|nr:hypothetical protein [Phycisphaerales bacterium]
MNRPYLVLWFALSLFVVLAGWGLYHQLHNPSPPTTTQPTTRPLVDRLREERIRRQQQQQQQQHTPPTTTTAPSL